MSHWAEGYVGKKYRFGQYDCAVMVEEVNREQFDRHIKMPIQRVAGLRNQSRMISNLQADYAVPTKQPKEGDGVLMHSRGRISHIGVYCEINNEPYVLHAMRNAGQVTLHKISALPPLGLKVEGYYSWL